ncbi:TKL protein kinase [Saprolegnia parasitica CBS 223.65]|uniref:TKL protein kinase n=1 Tax=Saprolegnia parasitica (strain CBS 223.65) TaxID=695850 RepID=A0A067BW15_SAPPC|nr:TKL protein kinase [Saprolegnia parasitica CBS 223.65]KDO18787.1 TKL protein kinase [Saprolegnia parasitica CBS 223.65]|eukprot:XP_012210509.1 TKL protein kinase [Saprolegnia parasitica CBS 223.65]
MTTTADWRRWSDLCVGRPMSAQDGATWCCALADGTRACATFANGAVIRGSITGAAASKPTIDMRRWEPFASLEALALRDVAVALEQWPVAALRNLSLVACNLTTLTALPPLVRVVSLTDSSLPSFPAAWLLAASAQLQSLALRRNQFGADTSFPVTTIQCNGLDAAMTAGVIDSPSLACRSCTTAPFCSDSMAPTVVQLLSSDEAGGRSNGGSVALLVIILVVVITALLVVFYWIRRRYRAAVATRPSDDTPIMAQPVYLASDRNLGSTRGPFQLISESLRGFGSTKSLMSSPGTTTDDSQMSPDAGMMGHLHLTSRGVTLKAHTVHKLPILQPKDIKVILPISAKCSMWIGRFKGREVVMKRVHAQEVGDAKIQTFVADVNAIAQLKHPHMLRLYGIARMNDFELCVVAELMSMGSLAQVLQTASLPLTWPQQICLAWQVASAVAYLHSTDDNHPRLWTLTSHHVLVNTQLVCKLNVFDFMANYEHVDAVVGTSFGSRTLAFEAPEVLSKGAPRGHATDVFALGVILSSIATRRHPYQSAIDRLGHVGSDVEILCRLPTAMPHEDHETFLRAPDAFTQLVSACLDWDPCMRPTAMSVVATLRALLDAAQAARPPPPATDV